MSRLGLAVRSVKAGKQKDLGSIPLLFFFFFLFFVVVVVVVVVAKHIIVGLLFRNIHPSLQYFSRSCIHTSLYDFCSSHVHSAL